MKVTKLFLFYFLSSFFCVHADAIIDGVLDQYKDYLEHGTYVGFDWSHLSRIPQSRYYTFKMAFEHFKQNNGHVVVELGTSRSFVHGGHPGCNLDDVRYWNVEDPKDWDWGAGFFTRMVAECLAHLNPVIHTVDIISTHIERCKVITADVSDYLVYHVASSVDFLRECESQSIDLLYVDTGDMTPIEPTALLQLEEAQVIVEQDLLAPHGIILIDDVRNQTPKQFGETSELGKAKYSIPYFLAHGFEIIADEYQVILQKVH
jgi:Methyltransferase domain